MSYRRRFTGFRGLPGLLLLIVLTAGCGGQEEQVSDGSPSHPKLILGYPAVSATIFPIIYAQEKGIFEEEGVEVEMSRIRGIPQIVATLLNLDIDLGWMGFDGMAHAVVEGIEDLRYVGEFLTELPQSLVAAPHIRTIEDLRGQPVATAGPGTLTDTLFAEGLMRGGLEDPRRQTEYLHLPGQAARLTQLLTRNRRGLFPEGTRHSEGGAGRLPSPPVSGQPSGTLVRRRICHPRQRSFLQE